MKTAVNWLVEELNKKEYLGTFCTENEIEIRKKDMKFIINKAKKIEEQQIIDSYTCGYEDSTLEEKGAEPTYKTSKDYYIKIFKSE